VADNEHPPRRDLEPRATPPVDPEQHRQFEQFQQFQQFLAFKEAQGEGAPPLQLPGRQRPMWKKILFSRAVRKLAFLIVVIIALVWAYNHYIGGGPVDDGLGTQGAAGPGQKTDPGKAPTSPAAAIDTLYRQSSTGNQKDYAASVCALLFTDAGRAAFTGDLGGSDCETVVRGLDSKVGVLPRPPLIDVYGKQVIELSSCHDLQLKPGTMGLGKFTVSKQGDGWRISGHEPEPDPCPTITSAPPTTRTSN
jgi:hypothetical protein